MHIYFKVALLLGSGHQVKHLLVPIILKCSLYFRSFWDIVLSWSQPLQKSLLMFTTGSDRIPIGGMAEMSFKITRHDDLNL